MAHIPNIFGLTIVLIIGIHIRSVHSEAQQNETLNRATETNDIHLPTISTPPITVAMEKLAALPVGTNDTTDSTVAMTDIIETTTMIGPSTSLAATEPITDTSTIKTTTTGDPQELLIPPASVNASIAQMFNNVSHKTGQIIIR